MRKVDVVHYFETSVAVAQALRITPQAVSQWGEIVPEGTAYKLQALTRGALKVDAKVYEKGSARAQMLAAHRSA